jgi:molybdate transport system regulatory protein
LKGVTAKAKKAKRKQILQPRLRILRGGKISLGPGKAELLAQIEATASIGKAAQQMKMSYMRAWLLVQEMNEGFLEPLVTAARGGETGGGAQLTETGKKVLALYADMNRRCDRACAAPWKKIQKLLR